MPRPEKRGRPDVQQLLSSLAAKEEAFLAREFLAPVVAGGSVRVRIGGVACRLAVSPQDFTGWGVFRPESFTSATLVRPATLAERREYLRLFPLVRLILARRSAHGWSGASASFGDHRVQLDGLAPVLMVEDAQTFDAVCARYDGASFWFDEIDPRRDPGAAAYLREALAAQTPPDELDRPGITAEERAAYEMNLWALMQAEGNQRPEDEANLAQPKRRGRNRPQRAINRDPVQERLAASLSHAGAQLVEYLERDDSFRVTYSVDGKRFTSSVRKDDLTVNVAGICLSGEDRMFDLASLVGVLREGEENHGLVRVGDEGIIEEEYWRVHPPRRP